jgi:Fic family protein
MSREERNHVTELLKEVLKWTKFQGMMKVKEVLLETLKKDEEKIVYQNSDGRDSRDIAKIAGISHQTVVNYWKRWANVGIVEPIKVRGGIRYKKSFSLLDFGIEIPKVKVAMTSQEEKVEGFKR